MSNKELLDQIREIADKAKKGTSCPSCGHCPECGRRNTSPYYPWYPGTYYPFWSRPNYIGTVSGTQWTAYNPNTVGGSSALGSLTLTNHTRD